MTNLDSLLKKQRHHFADKDLSRQSYSFPNSHVQMWELNHKESWALNNRCFQTVVLDKTLEKSPLDIKEIKPVHPKGNQLWKFIRRTDAETEAPILWSPDADPLEQTLILQKTDGRRRRGQQMMRLLDGFTESMDMSLSKPWETVRTGKHGELQSMCLQRVRQDWKTEQQQEYMMLWFQNWNLSRNILQY